MKTKMAKIKKTEKKEPAKKELEFEVNKKGIKTLLKKVKTESPELFDYIEKFADMKETDVKHVEFIMDNLPSIIVLYELAKNMAVKNEKLIKERAVKFNKVYKKYNITFNTPNEARLIKRFLLINGFVKKITDRKEQNRYLFEENPGMDKFKAAVDKYSDSGD